MNKGKRLTTIKPFKLISTLKNHPSFLAVLLLGAALRAYALWQTVLINPDGALYIYQAKIIVSGNWDRISACGINYVSIYPFLIAGMYAFIGNWIVAAQLVSTLFSAATLIPVYAINRRFFDKQISALATLVVALNPVMSSHSGDVIRGPIYWFFMAMGLYLVIRFWDFCNTYRYLFFSSCCYLLATWARIEAILTIPVTTVGLIMMGTKQLWRRLFAFWLPILILAMGLLLVISLYELPINQLLRLSQLTDKAALFLGSYQDLSLKLDHVSAQQTSRLIQRFIAEAQNHIWLIALGTAINRTLESFFYPFVPFFLIGLWCVVKTHVQKDRRWRFLLLMVFSAYLLLIVHLLQRWYMEYRFMMLAMIPAIPFAGAGLVWITEAIESRWRIKRTQTVIALTALILIAGLPKNLQPRDPDKIVFRQIAERIQKENNSPEPVYISSSRHTHRVLSLYANLNTANPPCPAKPPKKWSRYASNLPKMVKNLKRRGIKFFLYEERYWPATEFAPENSSVHQNFHLLGQWYHSDTGKLRLYQIK